jgi:hypothetical protein
MFHYFGGYASELVKSCKVSIFTTLIDAAIITITSKMIKKTCKVFICIIYVTQIINCQKLT